MCWVEINHGEQDEGSLENVDDQEAIQVAIPHHVHEELNQHRQLESLVDHPESTAISTVNVCRTLKVEQQIVHTLTKYIEAIER